MKGEEDMVDSAFKLSPTPFASNGAGSYPTAPSSADDTVDGAGVKVGRAASGRAAAAGGAADNAGMLLVLARIFFLLHQNLARTLPRTESKSDCFPLEHFDHAPQNVSATFIQRTIVFVNVLLLKLLMVEQEHLPIG